MSTMRIPEVVPCPTQDCARLKKAFDGWGTDEEAVIWVLGHRNSTQRRGIRDAYQNLYQESLIDRLNSELYGHFKKAAILWTLDPHERDAKLVNEALKMKKKGVQHLQVIVEVACATSSDHLIAVKKSYCCLFDCTLEEDIGCNIVSPPLRNLLVALVRSYRYDGEHVDFSTAESEATKLHHAIEKKKLDDNEVIWILSTRNVFQLKTTFQCYKQNYGNCIYQDIKSCGSGDLKSIMQVVICCIDAPEKHFAEVLRASIVGLGTDEDSLTRAIVSRAEIDMKNIKEEYYNVNKTSLDDAVIGDTSGDYKDFLLTLLGTRL